MQRESCVVLISRFCAGLYARNYWKRFASKPYASQYGYVERCRNKRGDIVLSPYKIAKQCGCKFYCGSDAHHPDSLDRAKAIFESATDLLELTEEDIFIIGRI